MHSACFLGVNWAVHRDPGCPWEWADTSSTTPRVFLQLAEGRLGDPGE